MTFIVTTVLCRTPGMSFGRLLLTMWAWLVTAFLILLSFSVRFAADIPLLLDQLMGTGFFIPTGLVGSGFIAEGGVLLCFGGTSFGFLVIPRYPSPSCPERPWSRTCYGFFRKPVFSYREIAAASFELFQVKFWIAETRPRLGLARNPRGNSLFGALFFVLTGSVSLQVIAGILCLLFVARTLALRQADAAAAELAALDW